MSATIRLSRVLYPVTVLGPGARIGIWSQGCSIGCAGCISRDTWDPAGGADVGIDELVEQCDRWAGDGDVAGVTLSGGEPFEQPEALAALLGALDRWRRERGSELDLLCYSGFPEARLRRDHAAVLERLDAVIPGAYVASWAPGGAWRGSGNQSIVPLTALGRARYASVPDDPPDTPAVQFVVGEDEIWMIGVPRPGDMERIERRLAERGVVLGAPSWR